MILKRFKDHPEKKTPNKEIMTITYIFVIMFVMLIFYLIWFTAVRSTSLINNSYNNKRAELLADRVVRGKIISADGQILASTQTDEDGNERRTYDYGNMFAHAVGFFYKGSIGVEAISNFMLLTCDNSIAEKLTNDLQGIRNKGDNVITTYRTDIQRTAYDAMGNARGAVVVMDVKTGEILALVSKPDFDPNNIMNTWDALNEDEDSSALLNRATQGLYPPGSTFKIVTALEYIRENEDLSKYEFDCNSSYTYDGITINCYHGSSHGNVDLTSSFAKSCNSSFANISSTLDKKAFEKTCSGLLFNRSIPCPYTYKNSYVNINKRSDSADLLQTGIGQGKTQVTPMHMLMITSAIANNGVLMRPMAVSYITNSNGTVVRTYKSTEYGRLMSDDEAGKLRELMRSVVTDGTGRKLKGTTGYEAAGKTGSAEYSEDKKKSHAWFTGFAPYDDPKIAVTVIVEDGGSGGETAAPIARAVFDEYFKNE